jgi:hypothetical protein
LARFHIFFDERSSTSTAHYAISPTQLLLAADPGMFVLMASELNFNFITATTPRLRSQIQPDIPPHASSAKPKMAHLPCSSIQMNSLGAKIHPNY